MLSASTKTLSASSDQTDTLISMGMLDLPSVLDRLAQALDADLVVQVNPKTRVA
jgi:hypothetical protein